jgi:hypothetical protein
MNSRADQLANQAMDTKQHFGFEEFDKVLLVFKLLIYKLSNAIAYRTSSLYAHVLSLCLGSAMGVSASISL